MVIAIIAILASLGVGVMAQAQNDASVAATRSRATMIQKILEIELEDYEVKRSPVPLGVIRVMVEGNDDVFPPIPASGLETGRLLLHVKVLRRMIMADLIRSEMPDGSRVAPGTNLDSIMGNFPSPALRSYLVDQCGVNIGLVNALSQFRPRSVDRWNEWATNSGWTIDVVDEIPGDGIDEEAANKSELLYEILQNIDVDGVPAVEVLSSSSIGDTDGDQILEILDGWGEPMFLEWQQEKLQIADPEENIWEPIGGGGLFCGLSCEHYDPDATLLNVSAYTQPVLPTQIRPRLTSEKLAEVEGLPADYVSRNGQFNN